LNGPITLLFTYYSRFCVQIRAKGRKAVECFWADQRKLFIFSFLEKKLDFMLKWLEKHAPIRQKVRIIILERFRFNLVHIQRL